MANEEYKKALKEYKEQLKKFGNAQLLDEVDRYFGYDGYYADLRKLITKELESRLNVSVDKFGNRFDKGVSE